MKKYTIYVQLDSNDEIIQFRQEMSPLEAIVVHHQTAQKTHVQLTLSEHAHTYLMASTMPGFYHRVKREYDGSFACSCNETGCKHIIKHPLFVSA